MKKQKLKLIKEIDYIFIIYITLIFFFGIMVLTSATHSNFTGNYNQIKKQIIAFILGMGLIVLISSIDYNKLGEKQELFYKLSIILLILVWIPGLGKVQEGARRWIKLGPLYLQTSELVKITFIISYAKYVESKKGKLNTIKEIIPVVLYASPVLLLMLIQPDLGGAIVFICIRIEAFLHPDDLSYEGNYQVVQSMIAIGSGGIKGKGLYNGTQSQSGFLPVGESDFVFAVIGEELGMIGMLFIVLLYLLFLLRMLKMANEAKDFYGTLIIVGVMSMFAYQIIQNIGMTMVLIPVTGVTLPLVSCGASSLVSALASLGLVINVGMRKRKINF